MFGNDVYAPVNGFTERFRNNYHSILNSYPGIPSGGVDTNSATGRGFALGVGFEFSKVINQNITSNYNINLDLAAGAEVDLSMMEYTGQNCADTSQRIGFAGWRARGSIGMYLNASAFVKRSSDNNTWNLANIKAGAWVDAKFPRPTYVAGAVQGNVQIGGFTTKIHTLGDCKKCGGSYHVEHSLQWTSCVHDQQHYLVNQSFNKSFTWGDDCASGDSNTSPDIGPAVAQEDAANSQQQNLIKYVHPTSSFNFPVASPIAVKYGLPLNEAFDVTEQQSTGSIKTRTFKLLNTVVLQKQNETTLVYANVSHNSNINSLSEYLYTLKIPLSLSPSSSIGAVISPITAPSTTTTNSVSNLQALNSVATFGKTTNKTSGPISSVGKTTVTGLMFTTYPAPTPAPSSEYDNLPPETPAVVNTLEANKNYKIIVTAVLKEYKNNVWINALKADLSPVQQVVTKNFRTGPPAIIIASSINKSSK